MNKEIHDALVACTINSYTDITVHGASFEVKRMTEHEYLVFYGDDIISHGTIDETITAILACAVKS